MYFAKRTQGLLYNVQSIVSGDGYISLAAHLTKFSELGQIPMNIDIARLNDGDGIEPTLQRHSA